ncbi:hypothetical protein [Schlesneria paludicola]|uniref:hypothetical protein n=1 Tax=Schlesneria paludicola TaxID=360056 RepID=UPI00029B1612|nr:hypothetical protein [Schlesneria paludicola]
MSTTHNSLLLLICSLLSGCTAIDSIAGSYNNFALNLNRSYPIPSVDDQDLVIRSNGIRDEVIATPRGSMVNAVTNDHQRIIGTLASINGESLELAHCICRDIVDAAEGEKQCRSRYLPSRSIHFRSLQNFRDITDSTLSPDEFRRNAILQLDRNPAIDSIVLKNGRQMQIPDRTSLEREMRTEEEISEDLSHAPWGSEICVIDESGRCMNAIVLEVDDENVELMSCITQEVAPDSRGRPQLRTTHIPFETLKVRAIKSFSIISSLPPGVAGREDEFDCSACVVEAFVARNGNRYCWGKMYSLSDE